VVSGRWLRTRVREKPSEEAEKSNVPQKPYARIKSSLALGHQQGRRMRKRIPQSRNEVSGHSRGQGASRAGKFFGKTLFRGGRRGSVLEYHYQRSNSAYLNQDEGSRLEGRDKGAKIVPVQRGSSEDLNLSGIAGGRWMIRT